MVLGCSDSRVPIEIVFDQGLGGKSCARSWAAARALTALRPHRASLLSARPHRASLLSARPHRALLLTPRARLSRFAPPLLAPFPAGDVFVVRNAGNLCGEKCAGTIDYAIHHLGIKLIVVLGHQGCGAVKAAQLPTKAIMGESPKLKDMLLDMKRTLAHCSDTLERIEDPSARDRVAVIANAQAQVAKILEDPGVQKKVDGGEVLVVPAFYEITSGIVDFIERPAPAKA